MPHRPTAVSGLARLIQGVRGRRPASDRLQLEPLLEHARRTTGLDDLGPGDLRGPLTCLIGSLAAEARLTGFGREVARTRLMTPLVNRLRLQADRARIPEVSAQAIERPLFVIGPPRTGTSILFRLLALDENALSPKAWQIQTPSPPPPDHRTRFDRRFVRSLADELFLRVRLPAMRAIRDTRAELPEECCVLQAHAFASILFPIAFDVPSYQALLLDLDHGDSYLWHHALLQQLQYGARRPGRWVLKSPGHLLSLPELFARYPDASIVQTHRDPLEFVPSLANLSRVLRSLSSRPGCPRALGEQVARFWSIALDRTRDFRAAHPELADRFIDVFHDDIAADPIAVVERIHARFDRSLTSESRARMERHLAAHPRNGHGRHTYSLEAFGLDRSALADRFEAYRDELGFSRTQSDGRIPCGR